MKKVFSIFTMALLLLATTACSDNGTDDGQYYTFETQMLNKSIPNSNPDDIHVSASTATVKWTYKEDSYITITAQMAVDDVTVANVSLTDAVMEYDSTKGMLVFTAPNAGTGVTNLKGYYDPANYTVYLEFIYNGEYNVTSVSQLRYPFITSSITNIQEGGDPFKPSDMQIAIVVNPKDMTAQMRIFNYRISSKEAMLQYVTYTNGLTATATATGYTITGTDVKSSDISNYKLNEFNATVTNNGLNIQGTFTANDDYQCTFSGTMFGIIQVQ